MTNIGVYVILEMHYNEYFQWISKANVGLIGLVSTGKSSSIECLMHCQRDFKISFYTNDTECLCADEVIEDPFDGNIEKYSGTYLREVIHSNRQEDRRFWENHKSLENNLSLRSRRVPQKEEIDITLIAQL